MAGHKDTPTATRQVILPAGGGKPRRKKAAAKPGIAKAVAIPAASPPPAPLVPGTPTDDQLFYLRMLARHLCTRKGIKTLTLADSAGIAGDQKQKENKTQAFLNRFSRGASAIADYRAYWQGVLKLYQDHKKNGAELFDDPVMRQAFTLVFPQLTASHAKDDSFIDDPLLNWLWIDQQRSKDVCRHYSGLWWIVRPSTKQTPGPGPEFNLSLLNIQPEDVSNTALPFFKFHQAASGTSGGADVTSQGRMLALDSDQILLLAKRRGTQTLTQLSWKYAWDPDRRRRENLIRGAIFTVNTLGELIQSYFHGCFIEGTDCLRGDEFEDVYSFLRGFLGTRTEQEMAELPTGVSEVEQLRPLQVHPDAPPVGISALDGKLPAHRTAVSVAGLERLKACPQHGPILTII
jgi:hypothetical protein